MALNMVIVNSVEVVVGWTEDMDMDMMIMVMSGFESEVVASETIKTTLDCQEVKGAMMHISEVREVGKSDCSSVILRLTAVAKHDLKTMHK
jgi:hypothetical protein